MSKYHIAVLNHKLCIKFARLDFISIGNWLESGRGIPKWSQLIGGQGSNIYDVIRKGKTIQKEGMLLYFDETLQSQTWIYSH